jgi:excisionase family DNA binding protein
MSQELVKVSDAATRLGLSPKTLYGWIAAKRIEHVRYGDTGTVRIPASEVRRLLRESTVRAERRDRGDVGQEVGQ